MDRLCEKETHLLAKKVRDRESGATSLRSKKLESFVHYNPPNLCQYAEYDVEFINNSGNPEPTRPFKITFPPPPRKAALKRGKKRKAGEEPAEEDLPVTSRPKLIAESYAPQNPGPYPQDKPPENSVRFTPVQVCTTFWLPTEHRLPVSPRGVGGFDT